MDQERFDRLTRTLATGQTRRGLLKGLAGTAIGGVLAAVGLGEAAAKGGKTSFCHRNDTGTYDYITVSQSAAAKHRAHGDVENPTFASDVTNCGACGNVCAAAAPGSNATATCTSGTCGVACDTGYEADGNGGCQLVQTCVPDGMACSLYDPGACCGQMCCVSAGQYCPPGIDTCCCTFDG